MSGIRIRLLAAIGILSGAWTLLSLPRRRRSLTVAQPTQDKFPAAAQASAKAHAANNNRHQPHVTPFVRSKAIVQTEAGANPVTDHRQSTKTIDGVRTRHNTDMSKIKGVYGYGKELILRFGSDECGAWAASLSFFAILSIAPILLCGLAILGFVFQSADEAARRVQEIVSNVVPDRHSANTLIAQLNVKDAAATLIHAAPLAALIGVLSLIWSSLQIFVNAVAPINAAFRAHETRNWLKLRLSALALLIISGVMFLVSLVPTSGLTLLNQLGLGHLHHPTPPVLAVIFFCIGMVVNGLTITVIYKFLPSPEAKVSWRSALTAGGIVAILSELAKMGFNFYVQKFANYNKVYGSLGGLIAIIFWIYYSSMILLLGAEIAKLYQDNLDYVASQDASDD